MRYHFSSEKGLTEAVIYQMVEKKGEPQWMLDFRLRALEVFNTMPMPSWGADLSSLDQHSIHYYVKPLEKQHQSWDQVPSEIKKTFDVLGITKAEQQLLAGVGAQFESEVIYKNLKQEWRDKGVIFCDMNTALREHEELFKKYFSTIIPINDNKFAALNSAVWSGGSFVYVPKNVHVSLPLQAHGVF